MANITLKCKSCGSKITIDSLENSACCEWCGNPYDIPQNEARDEILNLYSRADNAWEHKDFDEALQLYEQIIREDNRQAQAHFAAALCRYGISYETDPGNGRRVPTCNRFNRDSILDDKNYQTALKFASDENKASYKKTGDTIDRITKNFLKIVDKEAPYDVFISYKRTDANNNLTEEQAHARKLYYHLTEKKYKVFFAEITLQNIAGENYEPYIFAALSSAPVMVLLGTSRENMESTWVRNEWKRFLNLESQGEKKTLIPCCLKMDPYNLPGELRSKQSMDVGSYTFMEDITAIIEKKVSASKKDRPLTEGMSLADRYATPERVKRVVDELDCEEAHAAEVLINFQGKINESISYISQEEDYKRKLWICAECGSKNTHEFCHKASCGLSKKESQTVLKKREEIRRNSAGERRRRARKTRKAFIGIFVTLLIVAIVCGVGFLAWTKVIYPNMDNSDFNSPEIVQTYSGTNGEEGSVEILTILSCDSKGNIEAIREIAYESSYSKREFSGKIVSKKNSGYTVVKLVGGDYIVQAADTNQFDDFTVEIANDSSKLRRIAEKNTVILNSGKTSIDNLILSANDLKKLNNSSGAFILGADIDLSGANWTPIEGFTGTLVGNGFAIKNMTIESSASNVGFFATLNGAAMNLRFENANITVTGSKENVGILCGSTKGNVTNIVASGKIAANSSNNVGGIIGSYNKGGNGAIIGLNSTVNVTGNNNVGGIVGSCNVATSNYSNYSVTVESLSNAGAIDGSGDYVGGIFGFLSYNENYSYTVYMSELNNTGDISGKTYVGGLIGYGSTDNSASCIRNSSSSSNVTAEAYVGCIAGRLSTIKIENCSNENSNLTATKYITNSGEKYAYVGGFVGRGYLASNCTNTVEVVYSSDGRYVGGIMGYTDAPGSTEMKQLKNTAKISGRDYVGGIIGSQNVSTQNYSNYTVTMEAFENEGEIIGVGSYVGGIYGHFNFDENYSYIVYISEFKNTGNIVGKTYVGGLIGFGSSDDTGSYIKDSSNKSSVTAEAYVGCIAGRLSAIKIDGCTNAGSTIKANKYITDSSEKYAYVGGFVGRGYLASNCTNSVEITYLSDGRYVGGIMGSTGASGSTEMENLKNTAAISGKDYVGGIIGAWSVSTSNYSNYTVAVSEFENSGAVTGTGNYIGGVFGYFSFDENYSYTVFMTELNNFGNVSGKNYVGGIVGYGATDDSDSYIKDSSCAASITAEAYVGCIAGRLDTVSIDNCSNAGSSINATKYIMESDTKRAYVGGFVGRGYLVSNCTNKVNINYQSEGRYVGGVMGYSSAAGSTSTTNLINEATVKGKDYVGGIIGSWNVSTRNYSSYTVNIDSCENRGAVTGTDDYVGGIFGHMCFDEAYSYAVFMAELNNNGKVSGNTYVGGLIGYGETDSDKSSIVSSSSQGSVSGSSDYNSIAGKLVSITVS